MVLTFGGEIVEIELDESQSSLIEAMVLTLGI